MTPMPIVEVTWLDSACRGRWDQADNYRDGEPHQIKSCGYLLHRDKRKVILLQSRTEEPDDSFVSDSITIPTGCVQRIRRI